MDRPSSKGKLVSRSGPSAVAEIDVRNKKSALNMHDCMQYHKAVVLPELGNLGERSFPRDHSSDYIVLAKLGTHTCLLGTFSVS